MGRNGKLVRKSQAMDKDDAEYEAAKATLYEMLGYGIQ
jgi:hypothetical protein